MTHAIRLALTALSFLLMTTVDGWSQSDGDETGDDRIQFAFFPETGYVTGYADYVLDYGRGVDRFSSVLEFPIRNVYLGGELQFRILSDNRPAWRLSMNMRFTPGNTGGTMYDTDWAYLGSGSYGVWSYTESDPAGHALAYTFSAYRRLGHGTRWSFGVEAGIDYFRLKQQVDNFAGWQIIDINLNIHEFALSETPALDYRVSFVTPEIGFSGTVELVSVLSTDWRLMYGRVRVTDEDDHLLRKKISKGKGWGDQVHASLNSQVLLPGRVMDRPVFLGLQFSITSLRVKGTQFQQFYEDVTEFDPLTGTEYTIPKGARIDDLPHDIHSTRYEIGLRAGLAF